MTKIQSTYLFTSESVTQGHPDKICDMISDAVLDECLKQDNSSRVAIETMVKNNNVYIVGELTTKAIINIDKIVRETIKEIGYTEKDLGFDYKTCKITIDVSKQSQDISVGVDKKNQENQGAGDQGLMFGYATNETENYMPIAIELAHKITKKLAQLRENKTLSYLKPDGKAQVTVEYVNDIPKRIHTVLISTQHEEKLDYIKLKQDLLKHIIEPICKDYLDEETKILINPTGNFVIGGPVGDSGLTGRKIIVDSYGGFARHGGGCFSGKDPSKVDRSGAYMARWIAKNIVAADFAKRCEIQIAYGIGIAEPISVFVDCFNTNKIPTNDILKLVKETFDLRPGMITKILKLDKPMYKQTAAYGHFGENTKNLPWEQLNKVSQLINNYNK